METSSIQKEILLVTGTSFSSRQWCKTNDAGKERPSSAEEQLEEACWNGLLGEMLPEVYADDTPDKPIFLWRVTRCRSFLELELGELPEEKEKFFSIDPYLFIEVTNPN